MLIGAGCFADAQAALQLAERIAGILAGDLGGLLVEETIVTEVVDLPGQRVVTSSGTLVVAPSPQQVRTLIESDARAFRDTLSGLAQSKACKWSFERRHGDLIGGGCAAAVGWDILLLGHRGTHRQDGKVVLIAPPTVAQQSAVELAKDLAEALHVDLIVVSLGAVETAVQQREPFASEADLLAHINRTNASAVVLDLAAGPLHTHDQLRHLLAVARCPVLVLGAAQGEPSIAHTTHIPPVSDGSEP
ncbi:hypothetical protein RXV86_00015 [Alisedimentitalea sp. MJ-SS2]|uniref:hypothetical protein n=1 Tax=Aliisedimentitalea sp. MJ-SS2 TaxID=3049795 RepID=UPI00290A3AD1|nr:hypothetical protein [Alisedimentitalea sp. MJ-SS2]MDU8925759.1 hypothetical protein [Alisedimentitalea sp. MJ-SS2]